MGPNQDDPIRALIGEKKNRSKIGQIRELLPSIQDAHKAGVSLGRIVEQLNLMGIDVTYNYLRTMLHRIHIKQIENNQVPDTKNTNTNLSATNAKQAIKLDETQPTKQDLIDDEFLTDKQKRDKKLDKYFSAESTNPLLKRIMENKKL